MSTRLQFLKIMLVNVSTLVITLFFMMEIQAQPSSTPQPVTSANSSTNKSLSMNREEVQNRIEQVKKLTNLSEDDQKKAIDFYNQALGNLEKAIKFQESANSFEINSKNVLQRLNEIKSLLKQQSNQLPPVFSQIKILSDLEQRLAKEETQYEDDKKVFSNTEAEYSGRANRQKEALARINIIDEKTAEIDKQLKVPAPANEATAVAKARETELKTQLSQFLFEKPALKNELTFYDAEEAVGFPRINLDYLKLKLEKQKEKVDLLKKQIKNRRNIESEMRVKEARKKVFATNPLLQPLAEQNQEYAEEIQQLNKKIESVDLKISSTSQILEDLKKQFAQTNLKEESVGLTGPIGLLLRTQQATLPDVTSRQENIHRLSKLIDEIHLKRFELDEKWASFPTVEDQVAEILKNTKRSLTTEEEINLNMIVEEALTKQKEYLNTLMLSKKSYFDKLLTLYISEGELVKQTRAYSDYIQERVFWIKSSTPFSFTEFKQLPNSLRWLFASAHWKALLSTIKQDLIQNPVIYFTAFCCFLSLVYLAYNVRQQLRVINKQITRTNYRQFTVTARVAFLTLFIAVVWPGLIWFFAWRIGSDSNAPLFVKTVEESLRQVGWLLFFWELIRQMCRPLGLGESHFGWYKQTVYYVRRNIRWVTAFSLPLLFLTLLMHGKDVDRNQDFLERLFFVALMIVYTIFARRVFRPKSGLFQSILNYNQEVWYDRIKSFIYFLSLFIPGVLILITLIGYYFTALTLFHLLFLSLWLFLVVIISRGLLLRWILIHHRQLIHQQNLNRLHAARNDPQESSSESNIAGISTEEDSPADLTKISIQIKKLVNAMTSVILLLGLFGIWEDTFPAFNRLDTADGALWITSVQTVEKIKGPDGKSSPELVDKLEPVTYFDLGLAIIFSIFAVVATKNIPGLLEFLILQRLPLETSVKYAITSLGRYFIALLGIFIVFNTIGLGWTKLQWLATALTFGLAFGLQEIFANFVSGLILLIERPIRVGDIITVDEITGVVSRIRMRATTITNWDRKEYIVPNREFITGKLLNWTLTDSVNRILIPVGVAYGSDTNQASDLALEILTNHPLVLADPPASITFESFGDSTLNLTLRAYLPNLENRLKVIHELNTTIHEKFAEAGIEIAFPQRDVHLYTANQSLSETDVELNPTEPKMENDPKGTD